MLFALLASSPVLALFQPIATDAQVVSTHLASIASQLANIGGLLSMAIDLNNLAAAVSALDTTLKDSLGYLSAKIESLQRTIDAQNSQLTQAQLADQPAQSMVNNLEGIVRNATTTLQSLKK